MMQTVGDYLRKEREARNISLSDVAQFTKISKMYLDCLEKDEYKKIPGEPYVKGYISSYAEYVGINEHEALQLYDSFQKQIRNSEASAPAKPQTPGKPALFKLLCNQKLIRIAALAILVISAAGLYYALFQKQDDAAVENSMLQKTADASDRISASKTETGLATQGQADDRLQDGGRHSIELTPQVRETENHLAEDAPGSPPEAASYPSQLNYKEGVFYPPVYDDPIVQDLSDAQTYQTSPESDLKIVEAAACSDIQNRIPRGCAESFEWSIDRVYIWSRVQCESPPAAIRHIYYFKGEMVNDVSLKINSSHWRTWSYKTFLDKLYIGPWRVEIRSIDGELLKSIKFEII